MKILWKELRFFFVEHKGRYGFILICMIISSIALVIPARVIGHIVEEIVSGQLTMERLMYDLGIFLIALIVSYLSEAIWTYEIFQGSYQIRKIFSVKLIQHLLAKKMPFYAYFRTGDLVTRASEDVRVMGMTTGYGFYGSFNSILTLVAILYTMVTTISWKLALISLLPTAVLAYLIVILSEKDEAAFDKAQQAVSEMNNDVLEVIDGTYVVRAFGQEERMTRQFQLKTQEALEKNWNAALIETSYGPLCSMIMAICLLIGLVYGAFLVQRGEILIGDIVSFQVYIGMMIWPVVMVGDMVSVAQQGKASIKRILEVFHQQDGMEVDGSLEVDQFESMTFDQFHFTYPTQTEASLWEVSVSIQKGETIGVVGMTGSGKTTFLRQWLHQYPYQGEKIQLNGKPLTDWKRASVSQLMAYVPQEHVLFSRSIRENLYFGAGKVSDDVLWQVLTLASMAEDVRRMPEQLDTKIGEKGVSLSGGQKQRLSIARALLRNSDVLLLDDALSAVDAKTEQEIVAHLKETRQGKTNIITSHRLSAIRHADLILVFHQGRIVERGTHEELLNQRGWYYEQYQIQELEEVNTDGNDSMAN